MSEPEPDAVTLRRGEPETNSHYERAREAFLNAGGDVRSTERLDTEPGCPMCGEPMLLRKSYKGEDSYKFEGICSSGNEEHHILRYGHFVVDTNAPTALHLDGDA
jgi:hypothetical protein